MHKKSDPKKQRKVLIKDLRDHFLKEFVGSWIESLADAAFWNRDISMSLERGGVYPQFGIEEGQNLPRVHSGFFGKAQELYNQAIRQSASGLAAVG